MLSLLGITALIGASTILGEVSSIINGGNCLASGYVANNKELKGMLDSKGVILSNDIKISNNYSNEGIIIYGPTGSGKSSSFFIPNLLNTEIEGSIIVTDLKGELYNKTSYFQKNICKRRIIKISPLEPFESERYNLLSNCKNAQCIAELATNLLVNGSLSIEMATGKKTGGPEWLQMSEGLLTSVLIYANSLEYPFNNISFALKLLISCDIESLEKIIISSAIPEAIEYFNIFKMVMGADRTEGSIKITLASNLKLFLDNDISLIDSETTFNIRDLRKIPTIIYICYPGNKSYYLAQYTACLFSHFFNDLSYMRKNENLKINFMLDEFANIGFIPNMNINAAMLRSENISICICLQSNSQLVNIYGKNISNSIINNLKTKIVYPGISDIETLNYISSLAGEREITVNNNKTKIKNFENYQVRILKNNEVLIITSNKNPIVSAQERYYKSDKYINNIHEAIDYNISFSSNYDSRAIEEVIKDKISQILLLAVKDAKISNYRGVLKDVRQQLLQ